MMSKMRLVAVPMITLGVFLGMLVLAATHTEGKTPDTAAFYKSKCLMCHGKQAEKKFNASLTDDQLVEIVLNGKKAEKPPHMPAYATKGVTAEQAKALVDHMKQLKTSQ